MSKKSDENKTQRYIVKSNSLVEARYRLSLQESQIILWLLTQIRADDEDFKPHVLEISQFAKLTGVTVDNRYTDLRRITKCLIQRAVEIYEPETEEFIQAAWLSSARYQTKKGTVLLKFAPELKPYLLKLKSHFTKIDIADTLKLKSIYAVRLFELLLQYVNIGIRIISIEELRGYCGIKKDEYHNYFDLKRYVIQKAKHEINTKTEYEIDYEEIKESRKIVSINWTIKKKKPAKQPTPSLPKEYRSDLAMIEALGEYGFSKPIAKNLLKHHDLDVLKDALRSVNIQVERGNVRNPKAMLQTAINERWKPEVFKLGKKPS